jgi:hypothetical protein
MTPTRRTRAHASIATAASPEVRAQRAATLAEMDYRRQLAAAEAQVAQATEALERAERLSNERSALDTAMARLNQLKGIQSDEAKRTKKAAA